MMTDTAPTRKQLFNAALELAGVTIKQWCEDRGVSRQHVDSVLLGVREPGAELNAAINDMIAKYLPAHA